MEAGKLRNRVTLQRAVHAQDDVGGRVTTWTDERTVYASVEALAGARLAFARAYAATVSHKLVARFVPDISPTTHRAKLADGTVLTINAAFDPDSYGRELHLFCTRVIL
jgi:SPP1 family predicted phage head-tail adaptor